MNLEIQSVVKPHEPTDHIDAMWESARDQLRPFFAVGFLKEPEYTLLVNAAGRAIERYVESPWGAR